MYNLNVNKFSETFNEKGYFIIHDFLSNKDLNNLNNYFDIKRKKNDKETKLKFGIENNLKDLFTLKFEKLIKKKLLSKIMKKYNLIDIAKIALNADISEYSADYYYSPINENEMVIPWHTDQAYSGAKVVNKFVDPNKAALKFFFYLTDVDSENGCLGYVPGSHLISYYLKKLILEKEIIYSPYWKLRDYRKLISTDSVKKKLLKFVDQEKINNFLNFTSFIDENKPDTFEFDIPAKAGSVLIFDESGVHRGAAIKKIERKCVRFFFRK